jgi:hypothetical protein
MFYNCTSLKSAPELPATNLAQNCYHYMFEVCQSLIKGPSILPATNLASSCYVGMFYNCTSLKSAPELPATNLAQNCYYTMFYGCSSLKSAPELPATTLYNGCYSGMFYGCTNLNYINVGFTDWESNESSTTKWLTDVSKIGTFVCPEDLVSSEIKYGDNYIPNGWTVETY